MTTLTAQPHDAVFDEDRFRKAQPFALTATHLPGVYTPPAPPAGFDPNAASPGDLVRAGLLWKRPDAQDAPALRAAWDQVMRRGWRPEDRVAPAFHVVPGKTHILRSPPKRRTDGTYVGTQWSGAGTKTGKWSGVIGFWHIPTVSKPSEPQGTEGGWNSSSWIGLDGFFFSNDVLQAGVQQVVDAQGTASYVAWYEWFVAAPTNLPPGTPVDANGYPLSWVGPGGKYRYIYQTNITSIPVHPGDQVYCSVQYTSNNTAGYIYFANETTGKYTSFTLAPPPGASFDGQSVEWIMEAPDGGEPHASLPKFTPVTFTSALGCGPNNATANPATGDTMNIETAGGTLLTKTTVGTNTATVTFVG